MRIFRHYPKLLLLIATTVLAYTFFAAGYFDWIHGMRGGTGYLTVFIAGLLFSAGFTTPFSIAIFVEVSHSIDPVLGALVAAIGALIADMFIFTVMRIEFFREEFERLSYTPLVVWVHRMLNHRHVPDKVREYLMLSFAGIIIASPFPDEIGVMMISGLTEIDKKTFALISYSLNALGILIILMLSRVV